MSTRIEVSAHSNLFTDSGLNALTDSPLGGSYERARWSRDLHSGTKGPKQHPVVCGGKLLAVVDLEWLYPAVEFSSCDECDHRGGGMWDFFSRKNVRQNPPRSPSSAPAPAMTATQRTYRWPIASSTLHGARLPFPFPGKPSPVNEVGYDVRVLLREDVKTGDITHP